MNRIKLYTMKYNQKLAEKLFEGQFEQELSYLIKMPDGLLIPGVRRSFEHWPIRDVLMYLYGSSPIVGEFTYVDYGCPYNTDEDDIYTFPENTIPEVDVDWGCADCCNNTSCCHEAMITVEPVEGYVFVPDLKFRMKGNHAPLWKEEEVNYFTQIQEKLKKLRLSEYVGYVGYNKCYPCAVDFDWEDDDILYPYLDGAGVDLIDLRDKVKVQKTIVEQLPSHINMAALDQLKALKYDEYFDQLEKELIDIPYTRDTVEGLWYRLLFLKKEASKYCFHNSLTSKSNIGIRETNGHKIVYRNGQLEFVQGSGTTKIDTIMWLLESAKYFEKLLIQQLSFLVGQEALISCEVEASSLVIEN